MTPQQLEHIEGTISALQDEFAGLRYMARDGATNAELRRRLEFLEAEIERLREELEELRDERRQVEQQRSGR